jgi:exopolyphosphatase/guanosine-5'-triphosphate,3'-diphosphate pyrophosphatase
MAFIYDCLNIAVNTDFSCPKVNYILDDDILRLKLPNRSFLINSYIEKLELPKDLSLEIL